MSGYVHGYGAREAERLGDQAATLRELLLHDTSFAEGALVLEPACGIGSQTVTLAGRNPHATFVCFDRDPEQIAQSLAALGRAGLANTRHLRADLYRPPFTAGRFDEIFVCFVLEHLSDPDGALRTLSGVLKPGGRITVIEGDHGSCYFHPDSGPARAAWNCLIECQRRIGGNALIGRELYPLLQAAGLAEVSVSPRMVYCDASRPALVDGFVRKTIIPMVEGAREQSLAAGLIDAETFEAGIADLHRTAEAPGGTFCYTFFKGTALKRG